jgi:hypothetical protein
MPAFRFINTLLITFSALLCIPSISTAAEQTYVREYIYQASEADSKLSARAIALQEVKRELLSELGTHVSSLVKLNTSSDGTQLGTEEIETLSAGVTRVEILDEKWDGVTYVLKAQIQADPADVLKSLEKMLDADKKQKQVSLLEGDVTKLRVQNINISESLTQAKKETTAALAEIARLKKQLEKQQTDAARQTLQAEYKQQVDTLTVNEWFESATEHYQKEDYPAALQLFKKAAELGHYKAQFMLGWMYYYGRGVTRDTKQSVYWYQKAADQGDAKEQISLGAMYASGVGVDREPKQAMHWYQKAAKRGDATAQLALGLMYDNGEGVVRDVKQAAYWYQKAAEQGLAEAQFRLGLMYVNGGGINKDAKQALFWFRQAAEHNNAEAQLYIGVAYLRGEGVTKDYKQAVFWFLKCAEQGDDKGQLMLGVMYHNGDGVERDEKQAVFWFKESAAQGNLLAKQTLKELKIDSQ